MERKKTLATVAVRDALTEEMDRVKMIDASTRQSVLFTAGKIQNILEQMTIIHDYTPADEIANHILVVFLKFLEPYHELIRAKKSADGLPWVIDFTADSEEFASHVRQNYKPRRRGQQ